VGKLSDFLPYFNVGQRGLGGGPLSDLGHIPLAVDDLSVGRNVVPDQGQHHHHPVLRHTHDVGACRRDMCVSLTFTATE